MSALPASASSAAAASSSSAPAVSSDVKAPTLDHWEYPRELVREMLTLPADLVLRIECILLVVNENEFTGVFRLLQPLRDPSGNHFVSADISGVTVWIGVMGVHVVALAQSAMGNNVISGVGNTIHSILSALRPHAIISVGVAFGADPEKQKLGDVLVSSMMIDYSSVRLSKDGSVENRGVSVEAGQSILRRCRAAKGFAVQLGPLLSGPVLYDNAKEKAELLQRLSVGIGGEMEGVGVYTAAGHHRVEWIIVKSICDWGNGTKSKEWQPFCALQAARFVEYVLQSPYVWQSFPSRQQIAVPTVESAATSASAPAAVP